MADRSFLGWPFFDDRYRAYADAIEVWAEAELDPAAHVDEARLEDACRDLLRRLAAGSWTRHAIPDATGRLDVRTLCLTRETLARRSGLADFVFAMQGLGAGPISLFGSDDQKAEWLPRVASGEVAAAFALSEPEAGSDAGAIRMTATPDGDGWVLNGTKTWISNGGLAGLYVVFARSEAEAPAGKGVSAFIVEGDTPGLSVEARIAVSAPHPLATLKFEDVRVPADRLIGARGGGMRVALGTLDVFRSTVGAAALGFARRALDEALARVTTRTLYGAPMGELQLVQGRIADMALQIDAAALLVYRAAWAKDQGAERVTREAAMAKLYATEAAQAVVDSAIQLLGGLGVVAGSPLETLYREVRALRIYEGASDVQKVVIARQTLAGWRG